LPLTLAVGRVGEWRGRERLSCGRLYLGASFCLLYTTKEGRIVTRHYVCTVLYWSEPKLVGFWKDEFWGLGLGKVSVAFFLSWFGGLGLGEWSFCGWGFGSGGGFLAMRMYVGLCDLRWC
jgi:hypothetical protein